MIDVVRPSGVAPQFEAYVATFVDAIRALPFVECVYVDVSHGLNIFTVYRGDFFKVIDPLVAAEGEAVGLFPYTPVNFQFRIRSRW